MPRGGRSHAHRRVTLSHRSSVGYALHHRHSTRTFEDLVESLHAHAIQTLVDIRAFPMSRRLPQFNRESLEKSLLAVGIRYVWMPTLGGYRKKSREDSPNIALRNASFRNYADYMLTAEFAGAIANWLRWPRTRAPPTCAPSAYTFAAIACWSRTGWLRMP